MADIRFYLSLFIRRLPYFLVVAAVVSAVSVIVAVTLPPAFESRTRLVLETSQIPDELAASTVRVPGLERLQLIEQRLMTRPNLLDIANRLNVLEDQSSMAADEIVEAMRARTRISFNAGRDQARLLSINFEARSARLSAQVLNEYLTLIQEGDISFRQGRAGQTMDFFEVEVQRLGADLEELSAGILEFKNANIDSLPDSLNFRQSQRAAFQERVEENEREIFELGSQRQQFITLFNESRDQQVSVLPQTTAEKNLSDAKSELESALTVYSEANPRVKLLKARIAQLEKVVERERGSVPESSGDESGGFVTGNPALDLRIAEIDTRIETLTTQRNAALERIEELTESIEKTPEIAIQLDELTREYAILLEQHNAAVQRLARASTGERIEVLSRGERISIIEQPSVPSRPTKPNRIKIAGGGTMLGIMLGIGLIVLLEFLNRAPRRPEDIIKKLDVWPLAAIPYTRTKRELVFQRSRKLAVILIILIGGPVAVWAVHVYYLPLDLLADKVMNKLGVRW